MMAVCSEWFISPSSGKAVHAEQVTDTLDVGGRPGQEVPGRRIGVPLAGILRQHVGRVVDRVERHRQQHQIASELRLETFLQHAEVVGDAQAEIRQRDNWCR